MIPKNAVLIIALSLPILTSEHVNPENGHHSPALSQDSRQNTASELPLNSNEILFLKGIHHISMCVDPDWMPYDSISSHGEYFGINADFHQIFAERIGKQIKVVKTHNWEQSLEFIKKRKCDILSSAQITEERKQYLAFTRPFNIYPIAIATRTDQNFIANLERVLNKQFVTVKGHAVNDMLKQKYPHMSITQVENARKGLDLVSRGNAFGYIDTVASIGYQTQKYGILNIKISGVTQENYAMSVAVRNDQPLLLSIFNKAVASLSEAERISILNKWISIKFEQKVDYTQTWKILSAIGVILLLLALREYIVSKYKAKLIALNKDLEQLSNTDSLTGIANRHLLNNLFFKEIARVQRYASKFSIIMLDVDHFKNINDNFGHSMGDHVLKNVAKLISGEIRTNDTVGRWGGEEFLILCPETDQNGALQLAESIRQKIEQYDFDIPIIITVSLGVAEYKDEQSLENFIRDADNALYKAKNEGRNRTRASE